MAAADAIPGVDHVARRPSDRLALVEHVRDSPELQEPDWLEWKIGYDLTTKPGRAKTAKGLIGLANRPVDLAARHADGYGYLLLGVEPGSCPGMPEHDSADLENWLRPYVGDALVYEPVPIRVGEVIVLVFIVDPPRWGDPIHTLKTDCQDPATGKKMEAGTIYVRKPGKTEIAGPDDVTWLTERARGLGQSLALNLRSVLPIRAFDPDTLTDEFAADAMEAFRRKWIAPLPKPSSDPFSGFGRHIAGEFRNPNTFTEEVDGFIAAARANWTTFAIFKNMEADPQTLRLVVENPTDENYEELVLEVVVPLHRALVHRTLGGAHTFLEIPDEPRRWGDLSLLFQPQPIVHANAPAPGVELEEINSKTTLLRFAPFRARPRTPHTMTDVLLSLPPPLSGKHLDLSWRATSASTRGDLKGDLSVPVLEYTSESSAMLTFVARP